MLLKNEMLSLAVSLGVRPKLAPFCGALNQFKEVGTDIFFLKHACSIFRQSSNPVKGWEMIHLLIFLMAAGFGDTHNPSKRFSSHLVLCFMKEPSQFGPNSLEPN